MTVINSLTTADNKFRRSLWCSWAPFIVGMPAFVVSDIVFLCVRGSRKISFERHMRGYSTYLLKFLQRILHFFYMSGEAW